MIKKVKKRVLPWLMAMVILVGTVATFQGVNLGASACDTSYNCGTLKDFKITSENIEAAIGWACKLADAGAREWYSKTIGGMTSSFGWCTRFVSDAFYDGANLSVQAVNSAPHFLNGHGHRIYQGDPPRGAIALYTGGSDGYGHVAISLGNGRLVEGGNGKVQYNNLSLTMHTTSSPYTYGGYMWYGDMQPPIYEPETPPTISAPTTKAEVETRINSIINGQYGNGKTFPYSSTPVPVSLAGEAGGTGTFGYARYVFYQVFGISMSPGVAQNEWQLSNSNGNLETVASCGGTSDASTMKADIFKTKPGDVIQGKGSGFYQTMIVLSYDENSITILDCDNDYKCGIAVRTRDWAKFAGAFKQYTIYRSQNYPVVPLTTPTLRFDKSEYSVGDTVKVTWSASSAESDLDHYNVYLKDSSNNTVFNCDIKTTSYSFTLNKAGAYKLYVFAVSSKGNSIGTISDLSVISRTSLVIPVIIPSSKGVVTGDLAYTTTYSDGITILNKVNVVDGYGEIVINSVSDSSVVYEFFGGNLLASREYTHTIKNGMASGMDKVILHLKGDINGDGKLTLGDVLKANAAARNSKPLTGYEANVADINNDGNITLGDVLKMNAHARNSKLLW